MTNFIQLHRIDESHIKAPDHDATILLSSAALMIVFAIAIYLASMSAGTPAEELVSMTVFP
jgi:hypothetical protein